jgi:hypothetical protein
VQDSVVCSSQFNESIDPAAIDLQAEEAVLCEFTNSILPGNIVVQKVTDPAGSSQAFTFTPSWGAPFDLTDGQNADSGPLTPTSESGTYSVTEALPSQFWNQVSATCSDGSPVDAIDLAPDETVTCTFTNSQAASLTLRKQIDGGAAAPGDFLITLTGADGTHDAGVTYSHLAVVPILAGVSYTVSETEAQVAGYFQSSLTCVNDANQGNLGNPFVVGTGVDVTCTVTNTLNEVEFNALASACNNDTPFLDYNVTTSEGQASTVTITWIKNDGSDEVVLVLADLPLTGRLLWPGAAVNLNDDPIDWPGWDFVDGQWVVVNDGLVPSMKLKFEINPEITVTVNYPPATPGCTAAPPPPPPPYTPPIPVPVNNALLLAMLTLMMLGMGWYFRPGQVRRDQ